MSVESIFYLRCQGKKQVEIARKYPINLSGRGQEYPISEEMKVKGDTIELYNCLCIDDFEKYLIDWCVYIAEQTPNLGFEAHGEFTVDSDGYTIKHNIKFEKEIFTVKTESGYEDYGDEGDDNEESGLEISVIVYKLIDGRLVQQTEDQVLNENQIQDESTHIIADDFDVAHTTNLTEQFNFVKQGKTNVITFGRYVQKKDGQPEPIEWCILDKKDDRILVITRYAIEIKQYNAKDESITWENCSLRKWLNGTFLKTAFTKEERAMIIKATVSADMNPSYRRSAGNSTTDQIFLLSIEEVTKYFSSDNARQCKATPYCCEKGYVDNEGNCWWWLRSPGKRRHEAADVRGNGFICNIGDQITDRRGHAVRPAMWIERSS